MDDEGGWSTGGGGRGRWTVALAVCRPTWGVALSEPFRPSPSTGALIDAEIADQTSRTSNR